MKRTPRGSPTATAAALAASATSLTAPSTAPTESPVTPSSSTITQGSSSMPSMSPSSGSCTSLGSQGKSSTAVLALTAARAPLLTTLSWESRITRLGIPSTPKILERAILRSFSASGTASHGISPKYSSNSSCLRSEETNTISKFLPASFTALYALMSSGVNCLQGGHQCAEKYRPIWLPLSWILARVVSPPSLLANAGPRTAPSVGCGQGNFSGCMISSRPSVEITDPSAARSTRVGIPLT
mmetsp:Transcript_70102/g.222201  ORF Transcript_70102/g.222201 Transcript_70102/m.222201 type:complete len:242 (-) Transcript_70102:542-1267(-)